MKNKGTDVKAPHTGGTQADKQVDSTRRTADRQVGRDSLNHDGKSAQRDIADQRSSIPSTDKDSRFAKDGARKTDQDLGGARSTRRAQDMDSESQQTADLDSDVEDADQSDVDSGSKY